MEKEIEYIKNHPNIPKQYKQKLTEFLKTVPDLYSGEEFSKEAFPGYEHDIELIDKSISELRAKPYPAQGIRLHQLKSMINDMVKNGVLEPGDSEFLSPVFFVTKKASDDTTVRKARVVFDYRKINKITKSKNFPLLNTKLFFSEAAKFKKFVIIDIKNAFLSISLTPRAQKLLAIITPFGIFLPKRTPFGHKTSPSAFCFAMYSMLDGMPGVLFYMDDILVMGN